jgi:hypothetical protein
VGIRNRVATWGSLGGKIDASVHRSLSDLEPIVDDSRFNKLLLLGGDLNIFANPSRRILPDTATNSFSSESGPTVSPICSEWTVRRSSQIATGACPCGVEDCTHVWTFRARERRRAHIRYQDDHVFASPALAKRLKSCRSAGFSDASDRAPIVATFWLSRERTPASER